MYSRREGQRGGSRPSGVPHSARLTDAQHETWQCLDYQLMTGALARILRPQIPHLRTGGLCLPPTSVIRWATRPPTSPPPCGRFTGPEGGGEQEQSHWISAARSPAGEGCRGPGVTPPCLQLVRGQRGETQTAFFPDPQAKPRVSRSGPDGLCSPDPRPCVSAEQLRDPEMTAGAAPGDSPRRARASGSEPR